ncbi:hypothetical protein GKODMF_14095 [Candidatus Electrothrix gigas]
MQYIKECLQLIYWALFKPDTLSQHLERITPVNNDRHRPLTIYDVFSNYDNSLAAPCLKRYVKQVWWINVLLPICIIFFLGLFYNFFWVNFEEIISPIVELYEGRRTEYFNWPRCSIFLLGWIFMLLFSLLEKVLKLEWALAISEWAEEISEEAWWIVLFLNLLVLFGYREFFVNILFPLLLGLLAGGSLLGGGVIGGVIAGILGGSFGVSGMLAVSGTVGGMLGAISIDRNGLLLEGDTKEDSKLIVSLMLSITTLCLITISLVDSLFNAALVGMFFAWISLTFLFTGFKVYFWLPELFWTILLKFSALSPARRLRLLPTQFDQLIILPLPFMPDFIAQAYQENQVAARQTIDYLITSTNQQKAAQKAMGLIAVEECSRCRKAKDIAAIRDQLSWISNQQSPGLTACLDISQDVIAALEASSLYRKAQQLDKVIPKIDRQRNALAAVSAREATSFGSVLDSWQRILETARRTLHEQAAQSDEIPQVYLAGPALDPNRAGPLFKGRRDLFRQIETLTLSAQHPTLVMHGGRRSGKTSTLNYLPKWLPSDILPLLIDGQSLAATSTLAGFAEDFAEQLTRSAHKVHALQLPTLESIKQSDDSFVRLRRWLDAIEQNIPNKTLLLCLDEFERLDEIVQTTGSRVPLNFLRHLIQHRDNWTLLFTGALTPEELPAYWSDYLINCQTLRISYLTEADCLELIQQPVEDFPDIYPAAVAQAIWNLTGGQPYFTQLLCHELVEQLNRDKVKTVRMNDLQTVLPAVFERGYQVFREFWESLTQEQRDLLKAVAANQFPSEEAATAAPLLIRKEILAQEESQEERGWSFRVPLIQQWIVNNGEGGLIGK